MIQFILGGLAVAAVVVYVGKKYHSSTAALSAVKAELAKLEQEGKAEVLAVVARLKSLL